MRNKVFPTLMGAVLIVAAAAASATYSPAGNACQICRVAVVCLLTLGTPLHSQAQLKGTGGPPIVHVIKGDVISAEQSGSVLILSTNHLCSGTLLTNQWAITAAHCGLDIATPANITVRMASQSTVGAFAVGHPSLDFALLRLATPFRMQGSKLGYRVPLYMDTTASLSGKTLRCRGYGCNALTAGGGCTGTDGTLRQAFLPVNKAPVDDYSFSYSPNSLGQSLASGDSGSGCFVKTSQGWALAGVLKGPDLGRPENWRDWAMAYVNSTPVPLPQHWFVPTSSHPTFLTPPLPNNYTDTFAWNPCPGNQNYSFSPTFDLEKGQDFISIQAGSSPVHLTGRGMTTCRGNGPITVSIRTSGSHQSIGLRSMPISCNYSGPSFDSPLTGTSPAVVGVGNNVYFLATAADGHIMYNRAELGQAGLCWQDVEGNGRTDLAPAAGAVGNHVFVAVKGLDMHVAVNQADLGHAFGEWFPQEMVTDTAPAAVGVGNNIYLFAKALDGRIMFNRARLGQSFVGWREVEGNGRTNAAPAAGAVGDHVFVVVKGLDGRLAINQADLGHSFGDWFPQDMMSDTAPAATGVGNNLYLFAKVLDGRIMVNRAQLGQAFVGWREVEGNGRTDVAPAAGAVGNHVFVAVKGLSEKIAVNQADLAHPFGEWF